MRAIRSARRGPRARTRTPVATGAVGRALLVVVVVVGVAAAAVGLRGVLQAPLAQADLERLQGPVDARASRVIGAPAPSPTLTVSDEAFFLTYTLAAGSQAYSGLLTERDCRVVIRVDRRESSSAKLVYGVQRGRGCMVPAQARVREARRGR